MTNNSIELAILNVKKKNNDIVKNFDQARIEIVRNYHKTYPMYNKTSLIEMKNTASHFGVKNIFIKDESCRFGLSSFKALGCTYAIGKYFSKILNIDISNLSYGFLRSKDIKNKFADLTFVAATDGNHGRAVAWTAKQLGMRSLIYMPKGTSFEREHNIQKEGATTKVLDLNYDDTVRFANNVAQKNNWPIIQDTVWEGYEDIPKWIMQGYATIALEISEQLTEAPTHIFLQAGTGSFCTSIIAFFACLYKSELPKIIIVEPKNADCFFQSAKSKNKEIRICGGDLNTIMVGLACGEPNRMAWEIAKEYVDFFVTIPDFAAANGMRILGNPSMGDKRIISGESGASAFGAAAEILTNPIYENIKKTLKINKNSRLLFINTEGDTDKKRYRDIVWKGKYFN